MVKLKISVTKEIIGRSANCGGAIDNIKDGVGSNCAIALAIKDVFPFAWTDSQYIIPFTQELTYSDLFHIIDSEHEILIKLPKKAQQFIEDFDESSPNMRIQMDPIEFEVEIPDIVLDKMDISEVTKQLQNHPILKLQEA